MRPALIVNENFPVPALVKLRERGVDVMSVQEDMPGASDETILMRACETGRWLVTDRPAEWILNLLDNPADVTGYMVVIGEQTVRRRLLPIRSS